MKLNQRTWKQLDKLPEESKMNRKQRRFAKAAERLLIEQDNDYNCGL